MLNWTFTALSPVSFLQCNCNKTHIGLRLVANDATLAVVASPSFLPELVDDVDVVVGARRVDGVATGGARDQGLVVAIGIVG